MEEIVPERRIQMNRMHCICEIQRGISLCQSGWRTHSNKSFLLQLYFREVKHKFERMNMGPSISHYRIELSMGLSLYTFSSDRKQPH